jgi:hypothetical protein
MCEDDSVNQVLAPLLCDPVTGRLECFVVNTTPAGGETLPTITERDDNRMPVYYGEADDGSGNIIPILADNRNGLLYCELVAE